MIVFFNLDGLIVQNSPPTMLCNRYLPTFTKTFKDNNSDIAAWLNSCEFLDLHALDINDEITLQNFHKIQHNCG